MVIIFMQACILDLESISIVVKQLHDDKIIIIHISYWIVPSASAVSVSRINPTVFSTNSTPKRNDTRR